MFKGLQFDQSVILLCIRWYLAYSLILRDLEDCRARYCRRLHNHSPLDYSLCTAIVGALNRRKRSVNGRWHVDETYIKVRGQWMYLYRAIDSVGDTVEFWFSEQRDLLSAKQFFRKALARHGRPDRGVIEGSQTNHDAIVSCDTTNRLQDRSRRRLKPIEIRKSKYLNNRIEQHHRRIKLRIRPMLGFKSQASAEIILSGIEMVHMMRKRQARYAFNRNPSLAEQFTTIAAKMVFGKASLCFQLTVATNPSYAGMLR